MVVLGVTQGMQPILGFNYGAKKYDRLKDTLKLGNIIATIIMTAGFILCMFFPHSIARMFTDDEQLIKISVEGLRYSSIAFPIAGIGMVVSNFFQSIGKVGQSILLSLTRQVIFLIPMLIILPPILGTVGVWLSIPISDTASSLLAFFMARKQIRKLTAV
jgi:Na+-driven multidrug efflux pump